jgi:ABC-type multidrug transport system ATPase subunit
MFPGTLITIAHRLHTIMRADCIVVLERGRVVECGPPSELVDVAGGAAAVAPFLATVLTEIYLPRVCNVCSFDKK